MGILQIYRYWKEHPVIEGICRRINQIKYKRFFLALKQNVQGIHRRMFLLSILSISFVLIIFLSSFDSSAKGGGGSVPLHRQRLMKAKLPEDDEQPIVFSKSEYFNHTRKISANVICFLVASFTGDIRIVYNPYPKLREKIRQLDERLNDNNSSDVIIFHTGYPFRGDLVPIFETTQRHVEFVNIDHVFYRFSPGFEPHIRDPTWTQKGKWNYHHMSYFWFKHIFELKIMQRYRYMMRLDDDSQILGKWPNIFDLMTKQQAVYLANKREADNEYILPGLTIVRNVTAAYIAQNKIMVENPPMLAMVFNRTVEIPHYWNNFEVVDLTFMRRNEVADFIQVIDESQGIFLYRWGDAPLRYIILALFAKGTEILHRENLGLIYCHPC